ncbi:unnamed protein product, partial [Mycena citricolor]
MPHPSLFFLDSSRICHLFISVLHINHYCCYVCIHTYCSSMSFPTDDWWLCTISSHTLTTRPMHLSRLRSTLPRAPRRFFASTQISRNKASTSANANAKLPAGSPSTPNEPGGRGDFRSPWFFKAVGVGNFIVIPAVGIYALFFWDWGNDDRETVVQPARRWLQEKRDAFYGVSSEADGSLDAPPLDTSRLSTAGLPKGFFKPFFRVLGIQPGGPAEVAVCFSVVWFFEEAETLNQGLQKKDLVMSFGETPVRDMAPKNVLPDDPGRHGTRGLFVFRRWSGGLRSVLQTPLELLVLRDGKHLLLLLTPTQEAGLGCVILEFYFYLLTNHRLRCNFQRYQPEKSRAIGEANIHWFTRL